VAFKNARIYVTVSKNPHSSHKHTYWKKLNLKIICEIMHTTRKHMLGEVRIVISEESFKIKKLYSILFTCPWGVWKSLFRFSSSNGVGVMCVYLQCGRHKQIVTIFLANHLHTYAHNQLHCKKYRLLHLSITGEHFKPNPSTIDICKQTLWLQM